jgi:hypothetical protein
MPRIAVETVWNHEGGTARLSSDSHAECYELELPALKEAPVIASPSQKRAAKLGVIPIGCCTLAQLCLESDHGY